MTPAPTEQPAAPEVALLCSELIRHDSSATGGYERSCAERVAAELSDMGLAPRLLEAAPRRSNVVTRIEGTDATCPALLVHIHLDVVPADPMAWTVDPFGGEVRDGFVWGRGAVDMKDMAAMTLMALRSRLAAGWRPRRAIVLAFVADEELGGGLGADWLVNEHPELFDGCTEAIGEAGGFSHEYAPGRRAYLVQTGEKGIAWLRLVARGRGGHGAFHHDDNPVATLAEAVRRIEQHDFGIKMSANLGELLAAAQAWAGTDDLDRALAATGPLARFLLPVLRNTYNVTGLHAGVQHNVVPAHAEALVDGRVVLGFEADFMAELEELVADLVDIEPVLRTGAVEAPFSGAAPAAIRATLEDADPGCLVLPTVLPIGTDAKHFARLGIRCYGFSPLRLPPGYDFPAMFHGVDERVPVNALEFGQRALEGLLDRC